MKDKEKIKDKYCHCCGAELEEYIIEKNYNTVTGEKEEVVYLICPKILSSDIFRGWFERDAHISGNLMTNRIGIVSIMSHYHKVK